MWQTKGKDIWIRARTNALAHKFASDHLRRWDNAQWLFFSVFVSLPVALIGFSLYLQSNEKLAVDLPGWLPPLLGVSAIVCNGLAYFLSVRATRNEWGPSLAEHRSKSTSYQLIAQKARRLDIAEIDEAEARYLCRHLEELFELCKASGVEPSNKDFTNAQRQLPKLRPLPFGVTPEELP